MRRLGEATGRALPEPGEGDTEQAYPMTDTGGARTRWALVWLIVGAATFSAFQVGKAPAAIPSLRAELGMSLVTAGWLIAIFNALGVVLGLFAGAMADALGHRRMVLIGLSVMAVASLLGGFAPDVPLLLGSRFLEGLGFILIVTAGPALIARVAPAPRDSRLAFSFWGTYMPLGIALMLLVSPLIINTLGWRGLWDINAALLVLYAILFAALTRELAGRPQRQRAAGATMVHDMWATMRAPGPLALTLCFATYTGNFISVMGFFPTYLIEQGGIAPDLAAVITALAIATNCIGNVVAGMLLRHGFRRWILITFTSATMGVIVILIFLPGTPVWLGIALSFVYSLVGGLLPASVLAATPDYAPRSDLVATTNGLVMQGSNLGQMAGPPAVAAIVASFGGWHAAPLYVTTMATVGIGFAMVIRHLSARRRARTPPRTP